MDRSKKRNRSPSEGDSKELWKRIRRLEKALEDKRGGHEKRVSRSRNKSQSRSRESSQERGGSSRSRRRRRSSSRNANADNLRNYDSSSEISEDSTSNYGECDENYYRRDNDNNWIQKVIHQPDDKEPTPPVDTAVEIDPTVSAETTSAAAQKSTEGALDPEVLEVMGERLSVDKVFADAIHEDFAVRFEEIIKAGLPEEEFKKLTKEFHIPENCKFFDPPKLNPEVKASLKKPINERDDKIRERQLWNSTGLAGLTSLLNMTLQSPSKDRLAMIKIINGVIKIYAGLQHDESDIRRRLIVKNIDVSMREALQAENAVEWLFGEKLDERVKTVKSLEVSSKSLKPKSSVD